MFSINPILVRKGKGVISSKSILDVTRAVLCQTLAEGLSHLLF